MYLCTEAASSFFLCSFFVGGRHINLELVFLFRSQLFAMYLRREVSGTNVPTLEISINF